MMAIGNAPCSWGVEFAGDPRNPPWTKVLEQCAQAGYNGIELGPIGYMPEDPFVVGEALVRFGLTLIGGVVFRPFHDPSRWAEARDAAVRTCRALQSHGARHLVLIDSIAARRASTAGRPGEAQQMNADEWRGFIERIELVARIGAEEYGLTVSIHPHAGGFLEFLPEVERMLEDVDASMIGLCVDTGHCRYAGFDPVQFMRRHQDRLRYVHFKDIDAGVWNRVVHNRVGFYDACAQGVFCRLGEGETDFSAVRQVLLDSGYDGWCTVEQDCDPEGANSPVEDATANLEYLRSIGFK